jgi:hypothetical protein
LHELPELSVDLTSAGAVKSGDKPAAAHSVFLANPKLRLHAIEIN